MFRQIDEDSFLFWLRIRFASPSFQLAVKLGRALRPGEYKLSVYQLLIHEVEVRDSLLIRFQISFFDVLNVKLLHYREC